MSMCATCMQTKYFNKLHTHTKFNEYMQTNMQRNTTRHTFTFCNCTTHVPACFTYGANAHPCSWLHTIWSCTAEPTATVSTKYKLIIIIVHKLRELWLLRNTEYIVRGTHITWQARQI